jgi:GMP synthase-like glutamine amidotransferase
MADILFIQHMEREGPGLLGDLAREAGLTTETLLVTGPTQWPAVGDHGALVVLGGPQSVYEEDKFPYLVEEDRFVKRWLAEGKPYLGICLGAQILAKALGAKVYPNRDKEIGWAPIHLSPQAVYQKKLFRSEAREFMAFHWHGDTFDLPHGALHLASSHLTRNQAFRHGANAWGLQFHLEVQAEQIREWARGEDAESLAFRASDVEDDIERYHLAHEQLGRRVLGVFLSLLSRDPANG